MTKNKKELINSSIKNFLNYKIQFNSDKVNKSHCGRWDELKVRLEKLAFKISSTAIREQLAKTINLITKLQDLRADKRSVGNDN